MKYLIIFLLSIFFFENDLHAVEVTCPSGQYLVRAHFRNGYTRSDGTIVKAATVKTYCKLLTKAYEFSKDRFKKGVPINWPHGSEKSGLWSESEKVRITESMEELPDLLLSEKINGIYRMKRSKDYPNPASSSDGVMVIYDSAFDSSRNLGRILGHELAHQNFNNLSESEQQDYRRATGWKLKVESDRNIYWVGRKDGYVEEDGKISFEEDYSNNLEHYLYDPDKLKKATPGAYNWLKKHFGEDLKIKRQKK